MNFYKDWLPNKLRITVLGNSPEYFASISGFENSDIEFVSDPEKSYLTIIYGNTLNDIIKYIQNSERKTKLVILKSIDYRTIKSLLNDFQITNFFEEINFTNNSKNILTNFIKNYFSDSEQRLLNAQRKKQLRELEFLNSDLQSLVEERTKDIEILRKEEEFQLQESRSLFKFTNVLGQAFVLDEIGSIIFKEFSKLDKLEELFIITSESSSGTSYLYRSKKSQTLEYRLPILINAVSAEDQFESSVLSALIANQIGRPVLKIIFKKLKGNSPSWIAFEWGGSQSEFQNFENSFSKKENIITLNIDRLFFEEEKQKASYFWEKTFDGIQDPITIIDNQFQIIRCNRPFLKNSKLLQYIKTDSDLLKGQNKKIQISNQIYEIHSFPIQGMNSYIIHFLDITRVEELYLQWVQQEKMSAVGSLAGNIAHELYNPLTGIRSLSQILLSETDIKSSLHQDLLEIEKASERCQSIITNLLDFTSTKDKSKERISLNDIILKTIPLLKVAMRPFRQLIDLEKSNAKCFVVPQLVQQVIFNLINNACQSMNNKGEIKITTFVQQKNSNSWICASVHDNGPGISDENKQKIFQSFFTTKSQGLGTGLGLSLSKKIIESLDGQIKFESDPVNGTVFTILFPISSDN